MALSRDGSRLAAGGEDHSVWVWRTDTGKMERVLPQQDQTEALTFSPDNRFLLSTTRECGLKIWDLAPGAELEPRSVRAWTQLLAFRPDGRTLAGMDNTGEIWLRDGVSGTLKESLAGPRLGLKEEDVRSGMPQVFGPGGQLAALAVPKGPLVVWRPGSNPLRRRDFHLFPPRDTHVRAIAFSPDGRYVAATHPDGIICIFRLAEPGRLPELPVWKGTELP